MDYNYAVQSGSYLNSHADVLVGLALAFEGENGQTIVVDLVLIHDYEIYQESILSNTDLGPTWMNPIVEFKHPDKLSEYKKEAHKLGVKATHFLISPTGDLYKKSYSGHYLLCLVEDVLFKIHEGVCGLYSRGISLA